MKIVQDRIETIHYSHARCPECQTRLKFRGYKQPGATISMDDPLGQIGHLDLECPRCRETHRLVLNG